MKNPTKFSAEFLFAYFTGAAIVFLAVLLLVAPPDGSSRSPLLEFIGRFHPLSVHFPVALLILIPLLEIAGKNSKLSHLQSATRFILGVTLLSTIAAAALGWCLARAGGYSGATVTQHMWGGVAVAALAWCCWTLRANPSRERLYFAALALTVLVVSFTGYRGGQLTHGENHLTELLPGPVRSWLGVEDEGSSDPTAPGGAGTFYRARIHPIFQQNCVTCHGPGKRKAGLRLDTFTTLMRGGKHGTVIKPGEPKSSELFRRISLSVSDGDVMPPENRRLLSPAQIAIIEQWIAAGASGTQPESGSGVAAIATPAPVVEVAIPETNPAAVSAERAQLAQAVTELQKKFPNVLDYESRGSADLVLQASWMQARLGDDQLAAFAPVAERIVTADFSNTAITDRSAVVIAAMKNLRTLRLRHTRTTDATVQALASLHHLELLSVFDTQVTPACLAILAPMPNLKHIYVGNTKISSSSAIPQELAHKLVF